MSGFLTMSGFKKACSRAPWFIVSAFGASLAGGCGGEDAGPRPEPQYCRDIEPVSDVPDPGSRPADCSVLDGLELFMLDDFEPGSARTGWYINNDRTALMQPPPETDPIPATEIPGGRCLGYESEDAPTLCRDPEAKRGDCDEAVDLSSRYAIHIRSGFLSTNGGVLGRNFPRTGCITPNMGDPDTICPYRPGPPEVGPCSTGEAPTPPFKGCNAEYDFSDWDGVVVWARKVPGSYTGLRARFSDVRTDEASCVCNPYTDQNDTSDGCDKFGSYFNLETDFKAFKLPFKEMQQGGWGLSSPGLDKSELMSFGLEFGRGRWDMWIDDIALYRSKR